MAAGLLTFVGRAGELKRLGEALDLAVGGMGSTWLLAGDAGIGKTRLAEELARVALERSFRVSWGRCWEMGGAPAYWPWIQVLRGALRRSGADGAIQRGGPQLLQLLPELAGRAGFAPPVAINAEHDRFALLDAVSGALCELALSEPQLIVLEDLHVADASSLRVLDYVARMIRSSPLVIVGTYRVAEARASESAELLARIAQDARTLVLPPLSSEDVEILLAELSAGKAEEELVATVHRRTEGNPLFLVELTRLLSARGALALDAAEAIPPTVRMTIEQRLGALPSETRAIVEHAAVMGRTCPLGELTEVFDIPKEDARRAMLEAESAAVVHRVGPGKFQFTHNLVWECLYREMEMARRESLHATVADALSARARERHPWSEIAHHLGRAGASRRLDAARACELAGEDAERALALTEAASHYRAALALVDNERPRRIDIVTRLGRVVMHDGGLESGRGLCSDAFAEANAIDDVVRMARAALAYGDVPVFGTVDATLVSMLEETSERLGEVDSPLQARVLARWASAAQPAPDPAVPIARAVEAVEMARRTEDAETLLAALRACCSSMMDLEDVTVRHPYVREHVELAERLGISVEVLRGHLRLVFDHFELGDMAASLRSVDQVRATLGEMGHPYYGWRAHALDATLALWRGDFDGAERSIVAAEEVGTQARNPNVADTITYQRLELTRLRGDEEAGAALTPRLTALFGGAGISRPISTVLAAAQWVATGNGAKAKALLANGALESALSMGDRTLRRALAELTLLTDRADIAGRLLQTQLTDVGTAMSTGVIGMTFTGPVDHAAALALATLGRPHEALERYRRAIASAEQLGGVPTVAWLAEEAASLASQHGGAESEVESWRARAREIAERLGMKSVLSRLDRGTQSEPKAPPVSGPELAVERDGEHWSVIFRGRTLHMKQSKGMQFLGSLVARVGEEVHVLELTSKGPVDGGDAGLLLDEQAVASYRRRCLELRQEIDEAEGFNDPPRAAKARHELDMLTAELSRAVGTSGRRRRGGQAAERARVNVQRRLRDAIKRLAAQDEALGRHLERSVRTGICCSYNPE